MMIKPLVHPKSIHDESPIGYLVRLAEENAYDRYNWLFETQGGYFRDVRLRDLNGYLSNISWCGYEDSCQRSEILSLSDKHLLMAKVRLCPLCLKERLYWKIDWHQRLYIACPKHNVWMIEDCPRCGQSIEVRNSKLTHCKCEFDFREHLSPPASSDVLQLIKFLQDDNSKLSKALGFEPGELSFKGRSNLIHFMAKLTKPSGIRTNGKNKDMQHIDTAKQNLVNVANVFLSGHEAFEAYLDTLLGYEDSKNAKLISFSYFYKNLYSNYPGDYFSQHKAVIESFINKHFRKEINNRHRSFSSFVRKNHPWISLTRACREFGLGKVVLERCVEQKMIRTHVTSSDKRTSTILYKPDIEASLPIVNDIVDAKAAAIILGVSKTQLKTLIDREEFKYAMSPIEGSYSTWQFRRSELERYVKDLVVDAEPVTEESITISEIMSYFSGRADNLLLNVLDAFRDKSLIAECPVSERIIYELGIRSIGTNKEVFKKWYRDKFSDDEYLSIREVAHKLGINQEFAYQLVNNGFLKTSSDPNSPSTRKVSLSQFEDFRQKYVLLSKLSNALEQSSTHVLTCLRYLNVYPIDHETEIKLRQKVYKRQSIAKLPQYSSLVESMVA